jgi:hypothetical protein
MTARTRKLIGTVLLLLFLGAYAWAAVIIGAGRITLAPHWAQLAYFLIAGPGSFRRACSSAGCRGRTQPPRHTSGADRSQSPTVGPYLRTRRLLLKLTTAVLSLVRAL